MKKLIAFLITLCSINLNASQVTNEVILTADLTDEQARDLGMTEILQSKKKSSNDSSGDQSITESALGYDLNNDAINSTLAEVVVIVNESDRSRKTLRGKQRRCTIRVSFFIFSMFPLVQEKLSDNFREKVCCDYSRRFGVEKGVF